MTRLKLYFGNAQGNACWFLVDPVKTTFIYELINEIREKFPVYISDIAPTSESQAQERNIQLFLDEILVPSCEKCHILRDGENIVIRCVQREFHCPQCGCQLSIDPVSLSPIIINSECFKKKKKKKGKHAESLDDSEHEAAPDKNIDSKRKPEDCNKISIGKTEEDPSMTLSSLALGLNKKETRTNSNSNNDTINGFSKGHSKSLSNDVSYFSKSESDVISGVDTHIHQSVMDTDSLASANECNTSVDTSVNSATDIPKDSASDKAEGRKRKRKRTRKSKKTQLASENESFKKPEAPTGRWVGRKVTTEFHPQFGLENKNHIKFHCDEESDEVSNSDNDMNDVVYEISFNQSRNTPAVIAEASNVSILSAEKLPVGHVIPLDIPTSVINPQDSAAEMWTSQNHVKEKASTLSDSAISHTFSSPHKVTEDNQIKSEERKLSNIVNSNATIVDFRPDRSSSPIVSGDMESSSVASDKKLSTKVELKGGVPVFCRPRRPRGKGRSMQMTTEPKQHDISGLNTNSSCVIQNNSVEENIQVHLKPATKDYTQYKILSGAPNVNDVIAFKTLEMDSSYQPVLSEYKEGCVVNFEMGTVYIKLEADKIVKVERNGKFDVCIEEEDYSLTNVAEDEIVDVPLATLYEARILS